MSSDGSLRLTEDGSEVALQRLQHRVFDVVGRLAEELLEGLFEYVVLLDELALSHAGDGERDALSGLHPVTHGVQSHHLTTRSQSQQTESVLKGSPLSTRSHAVFTLTAYHIINRVNVNVLAESESAPVWQYHINSKHNQS